MGSVMHFQRTLNLLSRGSAPGYLAVFIGGFGDVVAGCLSRVEKRFPGFLPGVAHATAYYHWDGGGCGVFLDRCGKIAAELEELRRECPGLPIVLIGHSYGGSCAVEVARRQSVQAALPPDHRRRGAPAEKRAPGLRGMVGERLLAGRGRLHGRGAQDRRPLGALRRGGRQPGFFRLPARPGGPPLFPPEARSHAV